MWRDQPPVVVAEGLRKAFGGRTVLDGLGFALHAGEILGLVGANGGGKTTTLRLIAGLIRPDGGSGRVFTDRIGRISARNRTSIGYMAQANSLWPELTLAENLAFHAGAHDLPAAVVATTIARYGLESRAEYRAATLSGGWARRAQFACATLHTPALLLLDEPTAGLDIVTRRDLWRWMAELAAAGTAILISTHDLAEAEALPRLILYDQGRADGPLTPAELNARAGTTRLEDAVAALA